MEKLLKEILEEVKKLDSKVTSLDSKVTSLEVRMTEGMQKLDDRITLVESSLIEAHEITREELKHEIQSNYTDINSLKSDFTTVKLVTADNMRSIANMEIKEQKN